MELLEQMLWIRSGFDLRQAWVWKPSKSQCFFPMRWVIPETVNFCFTILEAILDPHNQTVANSVSLKFQAVLDCVKIKLHTSCCFHLCKLCCVFLFQALTLQEFVRGCRPPFFFFAFRILDLWCHACVMRCTADRILGFDGDAHHIFKGRDLKGPNFYILCFVVMVRMQV